MVKRASAFRMCSKTSAATAAVIPATASQSRLKNRFLALVGMVAQTNAPSPLATSIPRAFRRFRVHGNGPRRVWWMPRRVARHSGRTLHRL